SGSGDGEGRVDAGADRPERRAPRADRLSHAGGAVAGDGAYPGSAHLHHPHTLRTAGSRPLRGEGMKGRLSRARTRTQMVSPAQIVSPERVPGVADRSGAVGGLGTRVPSATAILVVAAGVALTACDRGTGMSPE